MAETDAAAGIYLKVAVAVLGLGGQWRLESPKA